MDLSRLNRDELEYELLVRGYTEVGGETVLSMRRLLKDLVREESFGQVITTGDFQPDVTNEIDVCNKKIVELESYITSRSFTSANSNDSRWVDTKLKHLYSRLGRLAPPDDRLRASIANLRDQLSQLEVILDEKLNLGENVASGPVEVNIETPQTSRSDKKMAHYDPVYKWNFRFTGVKGLISVNAFLEQVEEYRVARGVSEDELFSSVIDLLEGRAKSWYRSVRLTISSWSDFVRELKNEFLADDFQTDFLEEIRKSYQGEFEPIGEFFARVTNMFNRLPRQISEEEKVNITRRILEPYYIDKLSLSEYRTISELKSICKKLESSRNMLVRAKDRSCNRNRVSLLEPDLAYEGPSVPRPLASSRRVERLNSIQCWNCKEPGHAFTSCSKPKNNPFCFRCGKQGVTKYNCVCAPKNANYGRRLAGRRS